MYKRLEGGRFKFPDAGGEGVRHALLYEEVVMLLEGIELSTVRRVKRFEKRVGLGV